MKKIFISIAVAALIAVVSLSVFFRLLNQNKPEVLLERLRKGEGDKKELVMRFNLSNDDVTSVLIQAYEDSKSDDAFRSIVIDLLFTHASRSPDERISEILKKALSSASGDIREQVVEGYYMNFRRGKTLRDLIPSFDDSRISIRRKVCLDLTRPFGECLWLLLKEPEREIIAEKARSYLKNETDEEMQLLLKAVIGRASFSLCDQALQLHQKGDLTGAEALYQRAIEVDEEGFYAKTVLARFYLDTDRKALALETAERYDVLMRIPLLSQAPEVDGIPDDVAWKEAAVYELAYASNNYWGVYPAEAQPRMMVGHFEGRIYITVLGYEDDLDELSIRHRERDSDVWRDDCVELMLAPDHDSRNVYQFAINPIGALFDTRLRDSRHNTPCEAAGAILKDKGYWAAEFSVEGAQMNEKELKSGDIWTMTVLLTRIGAGAEQCAWRPNHGSPHYYRRLPIAVFE